ncbi:MAG: hypothetical protein ACE5D7_03610 [Fidelibacterota bacterium]
MNKTGSMFPINENIKNSGGLIYQSNSSLPCNKAYSDAQIQQVVNI